MDKLRRSWRLMVASLRLLRKNPKLVVLPLISGTAILLLLTLTLGGGALLLAPYVKGWHEDKLSIADWQYWAAFGIIALVYFTCAFIAIFFNSALVGCVLRQLEGKPHSLRTGLSMAWERRGPIFGWALLYSAIGTLLGWLEERLSVLPFVGALISKIILRLVGATWALVTFLVVPVIIFEEQPGVWARVRRSVDLFKRTWGEKILGRIGAGTALGILLLAALVPLWTIIIWWGFASQSGTSWGVGIVVAGAVTVLLGLGLALVSTALNGIYTAVLYSYAVTGMLPEEFSPDLLPQAKEA